MVFSTEIKQYRDHHTIEQIQKQVATLNLFQMYFHLTDMKIEKKMQMFMIVESICIRTHIIFKHSKITNKQKGKKP